MNEPARDCVALSVENGIARLTLDRAERHNAFDDKLIARLSAHLDRIAGDDAVRVVLLAGAGKSFSAGADLEWMRRTAGYSEERNAEDAHRLAEMMARLDRLAKPTVALVQGAAYGGGVGLVAACDIAVASMDARFRLSEVRLGLIPSVISPYVIAAIGARAARRYFLTAEPFDAADACRLGLVHRVVPPDALEDTGGALAETLCANGPNAVAAAKRLIADIAGRPLDDALVEDTAKRIAAIRATDEAAEGMAAFLEKRPPRWPGRGREG